MDINPLLGLQQARTSPIGAAGLTPSARVNALGQQASPFSFGQPGSSAAGEFNPGSLFSMMMQLFQMLQFLMQMFGQFGNMMQQQPDQQQQAQPGPQAAEGGGSTSPAASQAAPSGGDSQPRAGRANSPASRPESGQPAQAFSDQLRLDFARNPREFFQNPFQPSASQSNPSGQPNLSGASSQSLAGPVGQPAAGNQPATGARSLPNGTTPLMQQVASVCENTANSRNTRGWCAKAVQDSLIGMGLMPEGDRVGSARLMADKLANNPNFQEVSVSKDKLKSLPAGAVTVWEAYNIAGNPHGDVAVALGDGREARDYVQNTATFDVPYRVFIPKDKNAPAQERQGNAQGEQPRRPEEDRPAQG